MEHGIGRAANHLTAHSGEDSVTGILMGPGSEPSGQRNPDPGPAYREIFTDEVKTEIVQATRAAYEIVQDTHNESLGFNTNTFGHNVYHIGKFQLDQCFNRSGGGLQRVEELKALFRCHGRGYVVGFYKVGRMFENIWDSFPTSENGAMSVSPEGQPVLIGLEDATADSVENLRYAIIAHMGNPSDGLCAVYICIPIKTEGGKILRWGYAEEIYRRDKVAVGPIAPAPISPPPEYKALPIILEEPEAEVVVTAK